MQKLLIVSNRLPVNVKKKKGILHFEPSIGGLATGIASFYKSYDSVWVGWCGIPLDGLDKKEKQNIQTRLMTSFGSYPIFLSQRDIDMYYHGFCNETIWPLFHCFTQYAVYDKGLWESYKHGNELFCNAVLEVAEQDDTIWIHDYQLMLLPKLIREKLPEATIGFFLHIPFPTFEIFRLMPWRNDILEGLLEADLIGFHTYDYVRHFLSSVRRILGCDPTLNQLTIENRVVKVDAFPMGIDYGQFASAVSEPKVQKDSNKIRKKIGGRKIILSMDRLDYTKGILQRLEAFDLFLERCPEYKEKVTLILVAVPSRIGVEHYKLLKEELDELVGKINGKHGTIGWVPIWYLYRYLPFYNLVALYNVADVALITPLRDGMNLMAKEFIATKTDGRGVLILSEMAGAAKELGEAIIVNPNNKEEITEALKEALELSDEKQVKRNRIMQNRLQRYNAVRWANDFIDGLFNIKKAQHKFFARSLTNEIKSKLSDDYLKSTNRLILLDYDGTLIPFAETPKKAKPDDHLLGLLEALTLDGKNDVVIISGRDKGTLENVFNSLNVGLIAEHGALVREKGETWETIEPLKGDWKEEIRPILELYGDRTPGSLIEDKEFSIVWHYRRVDPELASVRASELKDALLHLTGNLELGVLEGNKVIEIKNIGINKGRAALRWLSKKKWDFVLAIGDDWTDEDVFAVLPDNAYSIKVGSGHSRAKFNLDSAKDVKLLLEEQVGR